MKNILEKYRAVSLRDKIIAFVLISALGATVGLTSGLTGDFFSPFAAILAGAFVVEAFTRKFGQMAALLVVAAHILLSLAVSLAYAAFNVEEYGYASVTVSFSYLMLCTAVFTVLAMKWSIGRLWLTLGLVYFALDFGGLLLMSAFGDGSFFFIPLAGAVALAPRCFLWRGVFSRNHETEIRLNVKSTTRAMDYLRDVLEANGDAEVREVTESRFGVLAYENKGDVWYLHPVHAKSPMEVVDNRVLINGQNYAPILHTLYAECARTHQETKKRRKTMHVAVVVTNAKDQQEMDLRVAPKGYQRNKKLVSVLSPMSVLRRINAGNSKG